MGAREKNTLPSGKQGCSMTCRRFNVTQNFFNTSLNLQEVEVHVIDHTALWFLVRAVTAGPGSQKFPTDCIAWDPKALWGASKSRRYMCVGTLEWSARSGSGPDSTHEDVLITCELDGLCLPTTEARAWPWSQTLWHPLPGVSRLTDCTDSGFDSLAWAWAGRDILLILNTHTSCTGRAQRSPTAPLASAAVTGEQVQQAWLGASLLAVTMSVLATESFPRISPLSLIRAKMPNLYENIYTLAFKCRHFSFHGESWPWCFLFIICLHCNLSHHWACC